MADALRLIVTRARYEFLLWVVSAFGSGLVTYLYGAKDVPRWVIGVATFVWLLSVAIIVFLHIAYQEQRSEKTQLAEQLEQLRAQKAQLERERNEEAINLTMGVIKYATLTLRFITQQLRELAAMHKAGTAVAAADLAGVKKRMLENLLRNLRSVLEADTRGVDRTTWPHNFFKIALYEPEASPTPAKILRRTTHDYPDGLEPSLQTETFSLCEHPRAAGVLAFVQQGIVVIEDIKTENMKPPEVKRWINRRENQADEYESMVCAAIVSGGKTEPDRKCLGVLVIDTNRKRYFEEERSFKAFFGDLLSPFRTALTFILELDIYFGAS
jgi:hypothetical protein